MEHRLSIVITDDPLPFRFSIHNAGVSTAAICYLRPPNSDLLVEWCRGDLAFQISETVRSPFLSNEPRSGRGWVRESDFTVDSAERAKLSTAIREEFMATGAGDDVIDLVRDYCFGTRQKPVQTAAGLRGARPARTK
jgi:hypothetical protein